MSITCFNSTGLGIATLNLHSEVAWCKSTKAPLFAIGQRSPSASFNAILLKKRRFLGWYPMDVFISGRNWCAATHAGSHVSHLPQGVSCICLPPSLLTLPQSYAQNPHKPCLLFSLGCFQGLFNPGRKSNKDSTQGHQVLRTLQMAPRRVWLVPCFNSCN